MLNTRQLQSSDFEAISGFAQTAEELFFIAPFARFPWATSDFAQSITERLSNTVFTEYGAVIGFANFYDFELGKEGFIGNVIVNPAFRRQGFGKQIIQYMIELAFSAHKFKEVHLSCFSANTAGLLLYRKLGFIPYGIEQRTDYKNESAALVNFRLSAEQYSASRFELNPISAKLADI